MTPATAATPAAVTPTMAAPAVTAGPFGKQAGAGAQWYAPVRPDSFKSCGGSGGWRGLRHGDTAEQHRSGYRTGADRSSGRAAHRSQ